jgi:ParB family chromosome partitioning protein
MAMASDGSRLGRGLATLIGDVGNDGPKPSRAQRRVPIEFLRANPRNPRRTFVAAELEELSRSISEHGVIQPIVVRSVHGTPDAFEIIAGERRWRAAQKAGLHDVPVVVLDVSDTDALEIAIVENVQRSDLNPMEEARGYHALAEEFKRSQDDIAKVVGKSRSHVANMMRLTKLPDTVQDAVLSGALSAGHARALLNASNAAAIAQRVIADGLSVRQTEALAHEAGGVPERPQANPRKTKQAKSKDANTVELEKRLGDTLGLKITIDHRENGGGSVLIKYRDLDQLDGVVKKLGGAG